MFRKTEEQLGTVPGFSREALRQLGRSYAADNKVGVPVAIGYGNPALWQEDALFATCGHAAAGGPMLLGAGRPVRTVENRWFPLLEKDGDNCSYHDRTIRLEHVYAAIALDRALVEDSTIWLAPNGDAFFEWLGFLLAVKEHPQGLVCR